MNNMKDKKIKEIKKKIVNTLKKYNVKKAGIFGSYAKGIEGKNSDVDILIEIKNEGNLSDIIEIKLKLENKLKKKIDLIEYSCIHPLIKNNVLKEEIKII